MKAWLEWCAVAGVCGLCGCANVAPGPGDLIDTLLGLDARPENPECTGDSGFPEALSDHACFEDDPTLPTSALVPYGVNAPLWSDGADKRRYLALPDGEALRMTRDGSVELPARGVLVKEFLRDGWRLETRFLVRDGSGDWRATTYVWNDSQSEAFKTSDGATIERDGEGWTVPSEDQCFECHTEAADFSLGLERRQLDLEFSYEATGRNANQINTLAGLGMLEDAEENRDSPLVSPAEPSGPLDDRARAYLHANCAHCHRPGGLGEGQIDLRASTTLRLTNTCNQRPWTADPVPGGGVILAPGDPEHSGLYLRMAREDPTWRMPPLGSQKLDVHGSELVAQWIASIEECP